jgi:hypothetical protein
MYLLNKKLIFFYILFMFMHNFIFAKQVSSNVVDDICRDLATATCSSDNLNFSKDMLAINNYLKKIDSITDFNEKQAFFSKTQDELVASNAVFLYEAETLMRDIKKAIIEKIQTEVDEPHRSSMIERIQTVRFDAYSCKNYPADKFADHIAFYNPNGHVFTVCPKLLLMSHSLSRLAFIMGHEISHSIGPCVLGIKLNGKSNVKYDPIIKLNTESDYNSLESYPYANVLSCLRNPKSVNAGKINSDEVIMTNLTKFQNQLCFFDQINESFSDWMSVEVFPKVMHKYLGKMSSEQIQVEMKNVLSQKCQGYRLLYKKYEVHPDIKNRANNLFMASPEVRKITGCSPNSSEIIYFMPPNKKSFDVNTKKSEGVN